MFSFLIVLLKQDQLKWRVVKTFNRKINRNFRKKNKVCKMSLEFSKLSKYTEKTRWRINQKGDSEIFFTSNLISSYSIETQD